MLIPKRTHVHTQRHTHTHARRGCATRQERDAAREGSKDRGVRREACLENTCQRPPRSGQMILHWEVGGEEGGQVVVGYQT